MTPVLIMLVEDNDDHAELITDALNNTIVANRVLRFVNAESALEYLLGKETLTSPQDYPLPGVVLLDLKLPGMDGFQMLRKIRSQDRTRRLPVVILTTSKREDEIARGYELGANSYIVKPVKFEEFRAKIIDLKMYWVLTSELPQSTNDAVKGSVGNNLPK
ncbi:MAG: response regulator [Candidatus Zixiibacteriota bacterium]|nr:MAG: response regulator [candidate division Zixibacteria bacterium]